MEPVFNFQEMFERSLGLKEPWRVVRAEFREREREVHVFIQGSKTTQYACPICGKKSERYDEEDEERIWRHADVVLYPCYIHCRRPRVKCEEDGVRVVDAPWARDRFVRFTLAFEGYAMLLAMSTSLNEARRLLRISRTAMRNIAGYWVDKAVREDDLGEVVSLCIDETSFKRGQSYVTIVGDPDSRRVIGVEKDRDRKAVERFWEDFVARGGDSDHIRTVSMDMSNAYRSGMRECFPGAVVVYDRFHVKKIGLDALDEVRRQEQGRQYAGSRKAGRKLLMIPERKLNGPQQERVEQLCLSYPKTGRAYRMLQQLDELYRCKSQKEAHMRLLTLVSWMLHSRLEPMKRVGRMLRDNGREILSYYEHRVNNGFAEAMNGLIQTAKRKARGFRTFEGFRIAIYLTVGKLRLTCPKPFLC